MEPTLIPDKTAYDDQGNPTAYWAQTAAGPQQFFPSIKEHAPVVAQLEAQRQQMWAPFSEQAPPESSSQAPADITKVQPAEPGKNPPVAASKAAPATPKTTTITSEETHSYRPEDEKNLRDNANKLQEAIHSEADAAIAKNQATRKGEELRSGEMERFQKEREVKERAEDDAMQEKLADYKAVHDDYKKMSVDSDRIWHNASTGDKIIAGFGLALGALGSTITGQPNQAMQVIEKSVDRDIDEQKANISKARSNVEDSRTMYQDFQQKLGSDRAARLATHGVIMDKLAIQADILASAATDAGLKAHYGTIAAEANQKSAAYIGEAFKSTKITKEAPLESKAAAVLPPEQQKEMADLQTKIGQLGQVKTLLEEGAQTGATKEWKLKAARMANLPVDATDAQLFARMGQLALERKKEITGTAASEAETENILNTMARFKDSPETALALISQQYSDADTTYKNRYNTYSQFLQTPSPVESSIRESKLRFKQ